MVLFSQDLPEPTCSRSPACLAKICLCLVIASFNLVFNSMWSSPLSPFVSSVSQVSCLSCQDLPLPALLPSLLESCLLAALLLGQPACLDKICRVHEHTRDCPGHPWWWSMAPGDDGNQDPEWNFFDSSWMDNFIEKYLVALIDPAAKSDTSPP